MATENDKTPTSGGSSGTNGTAEIRGRNWRASIPSALLIAAATALSSSATQCSGNQDLARRLDRIEAKLEVARELEATRREALLQRIEKLEARAQ